MYGSFGEINPANKRMPSERAKALQFIVKSKTKSVYGDPEFLADALTNANISPAGVKQVELALTSEVLRRFLADNQDPSPLEINNVLFAIENCGLADEDARDLLYSIEVKSVINDYSDLKLSVKNGEVVKHISPEVYKSKLAEIMSYVATEQRDKLTEDVQEELQFFAQCNIGEANYILGLMYNNGVGVKKDASIAYQYVKKAAAVGYPPAYAMLGDAAFMNNDYDDAYSYYSKPGAIALDKTRSQRVDVLFKAKGFARKVCIWLGAIYAALMSTMIFGISNLSLAGARPAAVIVFSILMTLMYGYVVWTHIKKPFKDLRHWGVALLIVFFTYLMFALI